MKQAVPVSVKKPHLYSSHQLIALILPLICEQIFTSFMGTVDSMMVSNVSEAAISAVSLVDSINILVIQAFYALASGGAIVCANYLGQKRQEQAERSANQLLFIILAISLAVLAVCQLFREPLLRLIFGSVEQNVMDAAMVYFFYTSLSFPFIALFDSGSAVFRAQNNSRLPMAVTVSTNLMNIAGNAILIWGFNLGVAGAAVSTLISRIAAALLVLLFLRRKSGELRIGNFIFLKPDARLIKNILRIGIPSGVENGMFQFGKLAIQSTVSTLGTTAIAAQAMTNIMENFNGIAGIGIGIGMMTVVGQCLGAGRPDEARYYIKKLSLAAELVVFGSCILIFLLAGPITRLAGLTRESASLCLFMISWITIIKPLVWTAAFIPGYGLRAAGDVKFSMILSCLSMWICRVSLCIYLIRSCGFGPIAVWIGMFTDWTVRGLLFICRFRSGKWLNHQVTD
ncbi:MAG: MATE family efflux transporter [Clostridium sp.]|nr:MATE family efflux transporter [Clostridium sp.]